MHDLLGGVVHMVDKKSATTRQALVAGKGRMYRDVADAGVVRPRHEVRQR